VDKNKKQHQESRPDPIRSSVFAGKRRKPDWLIMEKRKRVPLQTIKGT